MPSIDINILRHGDPPCWPDMVDTGVHQIDPEQPWEMAIIEGGMSSGRPSVALRLRLADGQIVFAETSVANWINATAAMRGAFPEAFAGTVFESRE